MSKSKKTFDPIITQGPIHKAIWMVAWPTILQNIVSGLQGLIDHAMVGHYVGFTGNAAIGVSWQIFLVVVVFLSSVFSGMGVLVARFAGAQDHVKVNRVVLQGFLLATFLGIGVFAPVGYFLAPTLLDLVNAEPMVQAEALPYLRILFVFSLGMMHFFMICGALRAAGDARTPMQLGILLTVLNITLNIVLIRGLGPIPAFGTQGAAMGTALSSGIVALVAFYWLFSDRLVIHLSSIAKWRPDWKIIGSIFRFGLPTGFQGIAMNLGGVLMIRYVGSLPQSAEAQAAFAVGYSQLFSLITWTSTALMAAAATIVGQNLGAGQLDRARAAPATATLVGLLVALPMAALFLIIPQHLLGFFGMEEAGVLAVGQQLLAYLSLSSLFVVAALAYTGALQGTGDTRSPLYISLISQLVLPLGLVALLDATYGLSPSDIWLAIVLGHFCRCVLSIGRFRQGRWQNIEVSIGPD